VTVDVTRRAQPSTRKPSLRCRAHTLRITPSDEQARAAWVESDGEATLVMANASAAAWDDPTPMDTTLPDGREVRVVAATVSVRFRPGPGGWEPFLVQGARVRSVSLAGRTLFRSDDLANEVSCFVGACEAAQALGDGA